LQLVDRVTELVGNRAAEQRPLTMIANAISTTSSAYSVDVAPNSYCTHATNFLIRSPKGQSNQEPAIARMPNGRRS
jgi:hypothetical protein